MAQLSQSNLNNAGFGQGGEGFVGKGVVLEVLRDAAVETLNALLGTPLLTQEHHLKLMYRKQWPKILESIVSHSIFLQRQIWKLHIALRALPSAKISHCPVRNFKIARYA